SSRPVTTARSSSFPSLGAIAGLFLRAGNLTFGGGHVITATLQRELVNRLGWLTLDQYGLAQSLAKITPGTGILAFCAATAWMLRRWTGALVAVVVASAPSAVFVVRLTWPLPPSSPPYGPRQTHREARASLLLFPQGHGHDVRRHRLAGGAPRGPRGAPRHADRSRSQPGRDGRPQRPGAERHLPRQRRIPHGGRARRV